MDPDSAEVQAAITAASAQTLVNYIGVSALVLFAYDYLITLHSEVVLFWMPRRFNGASILFALNRYLTMMVQILGLVPLPSSFQRAVSDSTAFLVLGPLQYLSWAAFSALRTYALCATRYRLVISIAVFALSSVPLIINMIVRTRRQIPKDRDPCTHSRGRHRG
ncbi:hypothetical protein DICSQDRAFT_134132 [Dichomitus squalens LYAD-421 SS1]|uniref:uncharacterized protein n=1 Tax=Dichomitus squalens (strain LYAD-421) TaxID=732165 RepID=UPI0004414AA8|nr:uncharacterized protein DICSQDRAFT_134132 [Dichomitus squalens LYAD-421 SS1]EJF63570.1 hypothetical protein DICSQDRAFT_134132 [Dichomitus squalens LYAD-421 SS1]